MYKKAGINFQGQELVLESGRIARQASAAILVKYGGTVVLVTVVHEKNPSEPGDFVPLTVNYQEKFWAAGKIPGGFFKREGRSTDIETLTSRLIDRPIRPLFPKGWLYETQIIPTVLSTDQETNLGFLAILGTSAALEISPIPFDGPVAGVHVGRIDGQWIINPTYSQMEESEVDLFVAGNRSGITMVEGGADMLPEEDILEGIFLGYEHLLPLLDLQAELRQAVGKPKIEVEAFEPPPELEQRIEEIVRGELEAAWRIPGKIERHDRLRELWKGVLEKLTADGMDFGPNNIYFEKIHTKLDSSVLRNMILKEGRRADGRDLHTVRPIEIEIGILPRAHGSALFTRGETQALAAVTLGTRKDERKIERLEEEYYKTFYFHYTFPPYAVGEVSSRLAPGRREIGHGALAERALARVLPDHEDFPYTIRVTSEITESNGSSSMASVCGGSLALMDAGVPVKAAVAGVAMGLIKEAEDKFHILTDIMGDEDHCGDMDFKVAGTIEGITALQMDIKIGGVNREIMAQALEQARQARLHILERINEAISAPRPDLSPYAPRIVTIQIPVDKIRDLIGPGGKVIRGIIEQTGAIIDVEDDGTVRIASADKEVNERVVKIIRDLTAVPEEGMIYSGVVKRITDFGAFVEILPKTEGLLHISEIEHHRIDRVEDVLKEGDTVTVKLLAIEPNGKMRLSRRALLETPPPSSKPIPTPQSRPADRPNHPERPLSSSRRSGESTPPPGSRPFPGDRRPSRAGEEEKKHPKPKHKRPPRSDDNDDRY